MAETGLEQIIVSVRDSPSLVWGRPAKSVVERPRGFNSHIPRHITLILSVSIFCFSFGRSIWSIAILRTFSEILGTLNRLRGFFYVKTEGIYRKDGL